MSGRGVICLVLAGCGRVDFVPQADAAAPVSCLPAWMSGAPTIGTPVRLDAIAGPTDERDPLLSPDALTLWFTRGGDVYRTTRPDRESLFGTAVLDTDLSSSGNDGRVSLTDDQLEMFAARANGPDTDVWHATRPTLGDPFTGAFVPALHVSAKNLDPRISGDGLRFYVAPTIAGFDQDLYVADRADRASPFANLHPITELQTTLAEADPEPSVDERLLLFTHIPSATSTDIEVRFATRPDRDAVFGPSALVPTINTSMFEGDPALSADGCELLFARAPSLGAYDLYLARVSP